MNEAVFVACLIAAALAMTSIVVAGVLVLLRYLGNRPGGLGHLARVYPVTGSVPEPTLTRQTIRVGLVRYKNVASLSIGRDALFLHAWGHSARIPWTEIRHTGEIWFQWRKWPVLAIGEPRVAEIVISPEAFRAMKDRIGGKA